MENRPSAITIAHSAHLLEANFALQRFRTSFNLRPADVFAVVDRDKVLHIELVSLLRLIEDVFRYNDPTKAYQLSINFRARTGVE